MERLLDCFEAVEGEEQRWRDESGDCRRTESNDNWMFREEFLLSLGSGGFHSIVNEEISANWDAVCQKCVRKTIVEC